MLVVGLFWKEMEISVCEGFGSKSEAVETSKNQQHNQYGGARGYRICKGSLQAKVGSSGKGVFSDFSGKGSL